MEARKIEYIADRFYVVGDHPESGSQWVEEGPFDNTADANDQRKILPEIDSGLGRYVIAQLQRDGSFVLKEMWEPEITLEVKAKGEVHGSR